MEEEINLRDKKIKILAVQMASTIGNVPANFKKVEKLLSKIKGKTFDFIVLPEVWTVGWSCKDFKKTAEMIDNSATIAFLSDIAKRFNSNVIGGSFIQRKDIDNKCNFYNTCPVLNRKGELLATYDKSHLFSYFGADEGKFVECGENPVMVELDGLKIGLTICYDIRFPEIYRAYRKLGADILVNVAAWSIHKKVQWDCMTRSRAVENQAFMIAVNQVGLIEDDENLGDTRVIDYLGNIVKERHLGEGLVSCEIKLNDMYDFRSECTILKDIKEIYDVRIK